MQLLQPQETQKLQKLHRIADAGAVDRYYQLPSLEKPQRFNTFRLITAGLLPAAVAPQSAQLLGLYAHLEPKGRRALVALLAEQKRLQRMFADLAAHRTHGSKPAQLSQDYLPQLQAKARRLALQFPEPKRVGALLLQLAEIKNPRVFRLLAEVCRPELPAASLQTAEVS